MGVENNAEIIEKIKILALSDEFTIYCLNIIEYSENANDEIFEIAKKVKGWGRVHAIPYLEVTNNEIKEWILEEGCHNRVVPSYTALTCAEKINLLEILNEENISSKRFNDISYLVDALLDEGAATGISALENKEMLIEKYLEKAKYLSSSENDYRTIMMMKEYIEDSEDINNDFIKICDEILTSEKTENKIKELMEEGSSYDIAKYIKIDTDEYALKYLKDNLLKNPYINELYFKKRKCGKACFISRKNFTIGKNERTSY